MFTKRKLLAGAAAAACVPRKASAWTRGNLYQGPSDILGAGMFTAYWSFRAFSVKTIGNRVVQLRRSSDSAVQDFGTVGPSGQFDAASAAAFAGAATLTVAKFYDQTGNGNDVAPDSSAHEQAFTPSTLNGMGVYDNHAGNPTMYTVPSNATVMNTYSHSWFAVWKSVLLVSQWQFIVGFIDDEISMLANDGGGGHNAASIKNEGVAGPGDFLYTAATDGQWHASVGVVDQRNGHASGIQSSFFNVDNAVTNTADLGGNPGVNIPLLSISVWGETGNGANTNMLNGYGAEAAWFANPPPGSPWTRDQAAALITNARAFWGF